MEACQRRQGNTHTVYTASAARCQHPKLPLISQVWESVPFLVSYQSAVIKEEVTILTYPDELVRTLNGNSSHWGQLLV